MTLRAGSGSAAHEREFGADILGVLTVDTRDFKTAKGFLAQAKRAEPRTGFSRAEWNRLRAQCQRMLAVTPDAFVLVYSLERGVRFFSARAVDAFAGRNIFDLYDIGVRTFFEKHFQSFIGDQRLDKPEIETLQRISADEPEEAGRDAYVLHVSAREAE